MIQLDNAVKRYGDIILNELYAAKQDMPKPNKEEEGGQSNQNNENVSMSDVVNFFAGID